MTSKELSLTERLANVQASLKAPKGQYNSFGKYKYRSCEDILEALKPLLVQHGLALILSDEPVYSGDWHYIKATATVTDGTSSYTSTAYAREAASKKGMDESQITGTASSYARKYALNGLFLIDDTKDADATNEHQSETRPAKASSKAAAPKAPKQDMLAPVRMVFPQYAAALGLSTQGAVDVLCQQVGAASMQAMTKEQVTRALEIMDVAVSSVPDPTISYE